MRADGLADRLKRAAGLLAGAALLAFAVLLACGAKPNSAASQPAASPDAAARALARDYQAENQAATDAYVERAAALGRPAARAEACRLASGALSVRPTVLADPPLERGAIEQRETLFAALQAYSSALDAYVTAGPGAAGAGDGAASAAAIAALRRRAADLVRAASVHERSGDLFIEDAAATFAGDVGRLEAARAPAETLGVLEATDPTVRRLIEILAGDFAAARKTTIGEATLAYARWRARIAAVPGAGRGGDAAPPPFCSEPVAVDDDQRLAAAAADAATAGSTPPASVRGAQLFRRLDAARRVDLSPVLQAMTTFDRERLLTLQQPENATAAANALAAREQLTAALHDFIRASSL